MQLTLELDYSQLLLRNSHWVSTDGGQKGQSCQEDARAFPPHTCTLKSTHTRTRAHTPSTCDTEGFLCLASDVGIGVGGAIVASVVKSPRPGGVLAVLAFSPLMAMEGGHIRGKER